MEQRDAQRAGRRRWLVWSLLAVFWTIVAVLFTSQIYFGTTAEGGEEGMIRWGRMLAFQMLHWLSWIPLTPWVHWLGRRFSPEPKQGTDSTRVLRRWAGWLLVQVPACLVTAGLHLAFSTLLIMLLQPFPTDERTFVTIYAGLLGFFLIVDILIYSAILGVGYGLEYYRRYRAGELRASHLEAQLAQAQLQALKMQLHPHFLFNTLHAIATLVRKQENKIATDMIAGLSELLRVTLENAGTQEVPLKQELEFLERYLEIEQIRFKDRLRVQLDIAPETLRARVPNLVLQPLVENAIRHGIAARTTAGLVEIRATRENGRLRLQVRDDGPGFSEEVPVGGGVGLANTMARLRHLYGEAQHVSFDNEASGGAVITLDLPFHES